MNMQQSTRASAAALHTCKTFAAAWPDLRKPDDVGVGFITSEPRAPKQAAHFDQAAQHGDRWQGLISGRSGSDLLVYTHHEQVLWEVTVEVPPHHLLAFHGRLLHAGAANNTARALTRGFIYFNGTEDGWEVDFAKDCDEYGDGQHSPGYHVGPWGFNDLCWQQGLEIAQCTQKRSSGGHLPAEVRADTRHNMRSVMVIVKHNLLHHGCNGRCDKTKTCALNDMGKRIMVRYAERTLIN